MKTIKLFFTGFWSDFDYEDNMFVNILRKRYNIKIDSQNPDFLICSPLGQPYEYMRYDCPRIMYTGEFISPDFSAIDYFIGFDDISFGDRALRFPLFLYTRDGVYPSSQPVSREEAKRILNTKEYFCNYIFGHDTALGIREKILEGLSRYKRVECAGTHRNNMPGNLTFNMHSKIPFMEKCKFSIAAESVCYPGFTSEKIGHAFRTHTIPIYFGDPDISNDFNTDAFIDYNQFETIDALVEKVIEIDQNDELYIHMLSQNRYRVDDYENMMYKKLTEFLYHIFDQEPEQAYRRPRFYRSGQHESYLLEYNRLIQSAPYKVMKRLGLVK